MSQYVTPPDVLPNKAGRSKPLTFIQPAHAPLQTASRPVELDSPEVNGIFIETDLILSACIGETLN